MALDTTRKKQIAARICDTLGHSRAPGRPPVAETMVYMLPYLTGLYLLVALSTPFCCALRREQNFHVKPGRRVSSGATQIEEITRPGMTLPFCTLYGREDCGMFQYIGVFVYNTWTNTGLQDDNPLADDSPPDCLRMAHYGSCDPLFKSKVLDNWVNIDNVRYSLIKSYIEVAYIDFNGTGSTSTPRLISPASSPPPGFLAS
ncbi:hypothetical protein RRG08_015381 [Elysia crispata]|uniref:Uncharacterized protein n=1 Tax=Elysia crispata TaxID=231223 RepID=A0AAE0YTS5_9GAST|nr:hypothetical protein RRG08_015381 [Elysia crispata]